MDPLPFALKTRVFIEENEMSVLHLAVFMQFLLSFLAVIWVVFWSFWFILAFLTRSPVKRRQSSRLPIVPIIAIAIWILFIAVFPGLPLLRIVPDELVIALVGTAITLAGLAFAIWARFHLGTNWSGQPTIKVGHQLIRTGPYKIVRNPIYTGILVAFAGTALVIGEFWAVAALLIILAVCYAKIRTEEKFLLEEFGESFVQYKKEVKALIPYIL